MSDLQRLAELQEKLKRQIAGNRIASYQPYDWQQEFHNAGKDYQERILIAGNRCITPWTRIETVSQSRRIAELLNEKGFYVRSWADGLECVAQASGVFLKGIEPAFRFLLDNGEFFDCSGKHRILTSEGWLSADRIVRLSSGLRWTQTREDYRANCGVDARQDGQRLRAAGGIGQGQPPLPVDARKLCLVFSHADVAERISGYSHVSPEIGHSAIEDGPDRIAALCGQFEDPAFYISVLQQSQTHRECVRSASVADLDLSTYASAHHQPSLPHFSDGLGEFRDGKDSFECELLKRQASRQSVDVFVPGDADLEYSHSDGLVRIFYPSDHPSLVGGREIIAIVPLGFQPIVDFTVAETANYFAAGVVHHNTGKTVCGAAEVCFHLTGNYPEWWEGKRFDQPVLVWTGSPTNETSRDIIQAQLLGGLGEDLGTGWIPRSRIVGKPSTRQAGVKNVVEAFQVRHKSGGISNAYMKTYEQGWQKFQGTAPHAVWLDEEPSDYMIYSESFTRVLTSHGLVIVTFTPLLGITELVEHFRNGGSGIYMKNVTWNEAPHLSDEDKERYAASYRPHERDARMKGIPMLGEGAVFPIPDEDISVQAFQIPPHFARIKGCDFGYDHPAAGVEIAWDRDQDIVYVIDCYKKAGELAPYHAAWFTKSNRHVPVAWPHDGLNTDKSGGSNIKDTYAKYGANMLSKSARYPRSTGEKQEKGGPQPQWPVIDEVRDRMMTGRFKVFAHLAPWFEEKRSYHVKMDSTGEPKLVARNDDILKATFYAMIMKRYAVPLSVTGQQASQSPHRPIASARIA